MPSSLLLVLLLLVLLPCYHGTDVIGNNERVFFSEILTSIGGLASRGEHSGWLELHNAGASQARLDGWCLSLDPAVPCGWRFPPGTRLAVNEQLLVFSIGSARAAGRLEANFELSKAGVPFLGLFDAAGRLEASVSFGVQVGCPCFFFAFWYAAGLPGCDCTQPDSLLTWLGLSAGDGRQLRRCAVVGQLQREGVVVDDDGIVRRRPRSSSYPSQLRVLLRADSGGPQPAERAGRP